jgi:hypothetical protein
MSTYVRPRFSYRRETFPVVTSSTPDATFRWQRRCWRVWIMASGHTWVKHSTVRFAAMGG